MEISNLDRNRTIAGAIASAALILSLLFLPWFELSDTPARAEQGAWVCGVEDFSCTGWETFGILRYALILAALAPAILGYILIRGHKLSYPPGEMTMVAGFAAFVLIAYNGILFKPEPVEGQVFGTTLGYRLLDRARSGGRDRSGRLHALDGVRRQAEAQGTRHRLAQASRIGWHRMGVISQDVRDSTKPDRNLALELVRVTEAAALAAARWTGRGDKEAADQAAVDAMRLLLDTVPMDGIVVIGEGREGRGAHALQRREDR